VSATPFGSISDFKVPGLPRLDLLGWKTQDVELVRSSTLDLQGGLLLQLQCLVPFITNREHENFGAVGNQAAKVDARLLPFGLHCLFLDCIACIPNMHACLVQSQVRALLEFDTVSPLLSEEFMLCAAGQCSLRGGFTCPVYRRSCGNLGRSVGRSAGRSIGRSAGRSAGRMFGGG